MAQWFSIQSGLSSGEAIYSLNVSEGSTTPGTQIILYSFNAAANELFQITDGGLIVSQMDPSLVLALGGDGTSVVIAALASGNAAQQWDFVQGGLLVNRQNQQAMAISGGSAVSGAAIVTAPQDHGDPSQVWSPVASFPPTGQWFFLLSGVTQGGATMAANVSGASSAPGAAVLLWALEAGSNNEMWQISPQGVVTSALDQSLVMSLGSGDAVVTATAVPGGSAAQQWDFTPAGLMINQSNGQALTVPEGGGSTPQLATAAVGGAPAANQQWTSSPGYPMDAILAQPPVPFPSFSDSPGRSAAWKALLADLGIDPRTQYTNLDAKLTGYLDTVTSATRPGNIPQEDWDDVQDQLKAELNDAMAVQALYNQYGQYHSDMFADNGARLQQLAADAQIEQGTNTSGVVSAIVQGAIYTTLSAIPVFGSVLGNVVQTAMNAALSIGTISPDPFEVAYSDLWGTLSSNFEALLAMTGQQEQAILSDWGKLDAVGRLTTAKGPDSLAWRAGLTGDLVTGSVPGYEIALMQVLLPAKYRIYRYQGQSNGDALDGVPAWAQWVQDIGSGQWNKYLIADAANPSAYPSQQAMQNDVWDNGAAQADVFLARNGWNAFVTIDLGLDCNWAQTTIQNRTGSPLVVTLAQGGTEFTYIPGPLTLALPAYGAVAFSAQYGDAPSGNNALYVVVQIFNQAYSADTPIASFDLHQHACVWSGADIWVVENGTADGYSLSTPVCTPGSYSKSLPGTVSIAVT